MKNGKFKITLTGAKAYAAVIGTTGVILGAMVVLSQLRK